MAFVRKSTTRRQSLRPGFDLTNRPITRWERLRSGWISRYHNPWVDRGNDIMGNSVMKPSPSNQGRNGTAIDNQRYIFASRSGDTPKPCRSWISQFRAV